MSTMYVSEYADLAYISNGVYVMGGFEPRLAANNVTFTGTPGSSSPFNAKTRYVRLHPDAICSIRITTVGTAAATTDARMIAGQTEYFAVNPGDTLSVIANT